MTYSVKSSRKTLVVGTNRTAGVGFLLFVTVPSWYFIVDAPRAVLAENQRPDYAAVNNPVQTLPPPGF